MKPGQHVLLRWIYNIANINWRTTSSSICPEHWSIILVHDAIIHHESTLASLFTIYHRVIHVFNSTKLHFVISQNLLRFGAAEIVDHINNYSIFLSHSDDLVLILNSRSSERLLDSLQNLLFLSIWQAEFVNFLEQQLALCITFLILLLILIIIVFIFFPYNINRRSITQHFIVIYLLLWANRPFWSLGFVSVRLFGEQSHRCLTLVLAAFIIIVIRNYCTRLNIIILLSLFRAVYFHVDDTPWSTLRTMIWFIITFIFNQLDLESWRGQLIFDSFRLLALIHWSWYLGETIIERFKVVYNVILLALIILFAPQRSIHTCIFIS